MRSIDKHSNAVTVHATRWTDLRRGGPNCSEAGYASSRLAPRRVASPRGKHYEPHPQLPFKFNPDISLYLVSPWPLLALHGNVAHRLVLIAATAPNAWTTLTTLSQALCPGITLYKANMPSVCIQCDQVRPFADNTCTTLVGLRPPSLHLGCQSSPCPLQDAHPAHISFPAAQAAPRQSEIAHYGT
jgi:hypothetical protein